MRRKDKQLTREETLKLFNEAEYGILSMVDKENMPYSIPMNFVFKDNSIYFHCSSEGGKKLSIIQNSPNVSFTVVDHTKIIPERFTTLFQSGIVTGTVEVVKDREEKQEGIEAILHKYSPEYIENGMKIIDRDFEKIHILKLSINKMTGKGKKN